MGNAAKSLLDSVMDDELVSLSVQICILFSMLVCVFLLLVIIYKLYARNKHHCDCDRQKRKEANKQEGFERLWDW